MFRGPPPSLPTRSNKWVQQGRTHSADTKDDKFDTCWRIDVDSFFNELGGEPRGVNGLLALDHSIVDAACFDDKAMNDFLHEDGCVETTIRGKWLMDGATSIEEAALRLEEEAARLRRMEADGWTIDTIDDDYGFCSRFPKHYDTDT